jgi:hypothetical protein
MLLRFLSHATRSLNGLVPEHHRVVMGVKLLQCSGPCTARVTQQSRELSESKRRTVLKKGTSRRLALG